MKALLAKFLVGLMVLQISLSAGALTCGELYITELVLPEKILNKIKYTKIAIRDRGFGQIRLFDKALINLKIKAAPISLEMKRNLHEVNDKLNDATLWAEYMGELVRATGKEALNMNDAENIAHLNEGRIRRTDLLRVVVRRLRARGFNEFSTLRGRNLKEFRQTIEKGPFFDRTFKGTRHGMDTHLIQLDFISGFLEAKSPGSTKQMLSFLSTRYGIKIWDDLFDALGAKTPNSPEYLTEILEFYLPLR